MFFETIKRLEVDWQLLQTAILSVELFQAQVPYHDMLTEELANTLDDWFDLMGEFNLQVGWTLTAAAFLMEHIESVCPSKAQLFFVSL